MNVQGTEVKNESIENNLYSVFSGADCIPYMDGEAFGAMYEINWQDLGEHDGLVVGSVSIVLFKETVDIIQPGKHSLRLNFRNQYGSEMDIIFDDIFFKKQKSGVSLDDIVMTTEYEFTATKPRHIPQGVPTNRYEKGNDE